MLEVTVLVILSWKPILNRVEELQCLFFSLTKFLEYIYNHRYLVIIDIFIYLKHFKIILPSCFLYKKFFGENFGI